MPLINSLIPEYSGRWIEPFLGTGVVALNSSAKTAILNDTNPHIIKFYKQVQSGDITAESVRGYLGFEGERLRNADEEGYAHFRLIRDRFNESFDSLDFLFLSRAGFNGMMRFNKKGKWNIPFCKKPNRFSPSYITKITNQIAGAQKAIGSSWKFLNSDFQKVIERGEKDDLIYCDPPYFGRYVDYYNGWAEDDERRLFEALSATDSKFILSTWHHNDYRSNMMVDMYWNKFNVVTRDHFYHSGGKIENRRSVVEALVCNFDLVESHNADLTQI